MTVRPNKRRFAIAFILLTGWTPWGTDLFGDRPPKLHRHHAGRWPLCCGHVLTQAEVLEWTAEGLLVDGPPSLDGRETAVAGPALSRWVSGAFHALQARRWTESA